MCGITGWVGFRRDLRSEGETLDAMTETMGCRGPDDRGTFVTEHAALGHRRLATKWHASSAEMETSTPTTIRMAALLDRSKALTIRVERPIAKFRTSPWGGTFGMGRGFGPHVRTGWSR